MKYFVKEREEQESAVILKLDPNKTSRLLFISYFTDGFFFILGKKIR